MKHRSSLLFALILMTALCVSATAQTTNNSTLAASTPAVSESREQVVAQLIAEVKTGRVLVESLRAERDALSAQVEAEKQNSASIQKSYDSAQAEIAAKDKAIGHLERAIALHEKTVALLQDSNAGLKAEVKKHKKRAVLATLVVIGSIALKVL